MDLDPDDVAPADAARVAVASGRYRLEVVADPASPAFDEAWAALDGFFGPRGELEDRAVIEGFVRDSRLVYEGGAWGEYRLVVAWEGDRFAGVRDFYVDVDPVAGVALVALAHAFVVEEHRRSGLAALFRAVPVTAARRIVAGLDLELVVVAEMEPVTAADPDSVVRLLAYGRSGFRALDPTRVPYAQPDFLGDGGIALLGVVRWVDHPDADALPAHLAAAFPRLFHQAHRMYLARERVDPLEVHALRALSRRPGPVALHPLPTSLRELRRLAPLVAPAVLAAQPGGPRGDPDAELAAVLARWPG